jgi:hypothetical protein
MRGSGDEGANVGSDSRERSFSVSVHHTSAYGRVPISVAGLQRHGVDAQVVGVGETATDRFLPRVSGGVRTATARYQGGRRWWLS